jgi:NAD(P)-dependent dehydrogenase (short-subunit alcohol dehydrogenase family)
MNAGRAARLRAQHIDESAQRRRHLAPEAGRIDVIVNNAGYGLLGATEKATDAELNHIFAVDVFAPFRIVRTALPYLRAQGSGHIVNITSVAGRAPAPGYSLYAAVKYALEGFSVSIAQELAPFGIKVTAIAPGAFRTDFLSPHSIRKSGADAAYAANIGKITAAFDANDGRQIGDPDRGAQAILAAVNAATPPLHLLLGSDALRRAREARCGDRGDRPLGGGHPQHRLPGGPRQRQRGAPRRHDLPPRAAPGGC